MSAEQAPTEAPQLSWSKETDGEAGRDFVGIIAGGEYPFHSEDAKFEGEQIQLLVQAQQPAYDKLQPIWLPPGNKKGTKFVIWRNHLMEQCPTAWREILPAVQKESEPTKQITAFIEALKGMQFHFVDHQHPRANAKPTDAPMRMLCPIEYKGRGQVTQVTSEKVNL